MGHGLISRVISDEDMEISKMFPSQGSRYYWDWATSMMDYSPQEKEIKEGKMKMLFPVADGKTWNRQWPVFRKDFPPFALLIYNGASDNDNERDKWNSLRLLSPIFSGALEDSQSRNENGPKMKTCFISKHLISVIFWDVESFGKLQIKADGA